MGCLQNNNFHPDEDLVHFILKINSFIEMNFYTDPCAKLVTLRCAIMTVAMRSGFVADVPDIESRSRISTNTISM